MPNDCWNHLTITCPVPFVLNRLIDMEIREYHQCITKTRGERGVRICIWSPNEPDFDWLSDLLYKYPDCWIKNEWDEEGGRAGVWVGFVDNNDNKVIKQMEWADLCLEERDYFFNNT